MYLRTRPDRLPSKNYSNKKIVMKNISSWVFVTASLLSLPGAASAQIEAAGVPLTTEEATAFIKGKNLSAIRLAGGTPSLQFKDNGTMYGQNGGSDSGKWRIEDGKLCMRWQRSEYDGCGQLVRVEGKVHHLYPNASAVHLVFNN